MFSVGEDVEADALFKRGWTVSAIARHARFSTNSLRRRRSPLATTRPDMSHIT